MGNDAAATEEISQHNQRARRDGTIENHQGGALTVSKLHSAQTVAGRGQPGRFHVEGKETIPREAPLELIQRGG